MYNLKSKAPFLLPVGAVLLFGLSLCGTPGVTAAPPAEVFLAGGVLACLVGLFLALGAQLSWQQAALLCAVEALIGVGFVSAQSSADKFLSDVSLCSWIASLSVWSAIAIGVSSKSHWQKTAKAFVGIVFVVSCYAAALFLGKGGLFKGSFTNPDCFSVLPLTAAFLCLGLIVVARPKERVALWLLFPFLAAAVALTGSRAGLGGFLLSFVVFAALAWKKERTETVVKGSVAMVGLALLALVVLGQSDGFMDKWKNLFSGQDRVGVTSRLDVLRGSVQLAALRPLFGFGPGVFHLAYQEIRTVPSQAEQYMNVAHNDFAQVWVEMGLVGLALWLAFLLGCGLIGYRDYRDKNGAEKLGPVCAFLAVLIYSLGNFAIPVTADFLALMFMLGLSVSSEEQKEAPRPLKIFLGLVLLGLGSFGLFKGTTVLQCNSAIRTSLRFEKELEWEKAYESLTTAISSGDLRIYLMRAKMAERLSYFEGEESWLKSATSDLEKAQSLCSTDLEVLIRLAALYESQGRTQDSLDLLRKARALAKHSPLVEHSIARNLILKGDAAGAVELLLSLGQEKDVVALGDLLAIMEAQKPGAGVELVSKWSESKHSKQMLEAIRLAGDASKSSNPTTARTFYEIATKANPHDSALLASLASVTPDLSARAALLKQAWSVPEDSDAAHQKVIRQALSDWADVQVNATLSGPDASKSVRGVTRQLEGYLSKHPEATAIRLKLSDLYERLERVSDARRILRDGLDRDHSGSVHAHLGALYQKAGSPDIALTYYEEALKLQPHSQSLKDLVEKLQSASKPTDPDSPKHGPKGSSSGADPELE